MPELVPVRVRDCACPHTPHADDGDFVYLLPTLPYEGGILAEQQFRNVMGADTPDPDLLTRQWGRTFVDHGADSWNLLDEDGEPVPFDVEVILADWRLARPVADKAAELYQESVLAPFRAASEARSPTGLTKRGTSPTRRRTSPSSD